LYIYLNTDSFFFLDIDIFLNNVNKPSFFLLLLHPLIKKMDLVKQIEADQIRTDLPEFAAGDNVSVHYKIKEGDKERVQVFQGTVLQCRNSGLDETFTVRKISSGVGVERIFPTNSPNIDKIEVNRRGKVRRARIFYLRGRSGKSARIKERR